VIAASSVAPAIAAADRLGECPVWDDRTGTRWRVDAVAGAVLSVDVTTGAERRYDVGRHVGSLVLRADSAGLLLAAGGGFCALDVDSGAVTALTPELADPRVAMNDGACDPVGRFVAGTMRRDAEPGCAGLYRYAPPDRIVPLLEGAGLSNGLCWDAAGTTLYWVDTLLGRVERLGYDLERGAVTSRSTALDLRAHPGRPDGLATDAEGCLWVVFWRGGAVRRFSPDGRLLTEVRLPVARTTSCCFGGDDLRDLYVTTARQGVRDAPDRVEPLAGAVFRVRVDVPGLPASRWRPDARAGHAAVGTLASHPTEQGATRPGPS
jgi:sugar lactone lactonase YvrE